MTDSKLENTAQSVPLVNAHKHGSRVGLRHALPLVKKHADTRVIALKVSAFCCKQGEAVILSLR